MEKNQALREVLSQEEGRAVINHPFHLLHLEGQHPRRITSLEELATETFFCKPYEA
jgi:hypothetical protein